MSLVSELRDLIGRERQITAQRRELAQLQDELAEQREQNERMRAGMRRCLSCDYRREALVMRAEQKSDIEGPSQP